MQDKFQDNKRMNDNPKPGTTSINSAFISGNPDFDPSKDVPQARGCDTMIGIISNTPKREVK
jgi:hypothetical protein